jgi:hypothetical protein
MISTYIGSVHLFMISNMRNPFLQIWKIHDIVIITSITGQFEH